MSNLTTVSAQLPNSTACKCVAAAANCAAFASASAAQLTALGFGFGLNWTVAVGQPQLANVAFQLNAYFTRTCPTRTAVCIYDLGKLQVQQQRLE